MSSRVRIGRIEIDPALHHFVEKEVLPGLELGSNAFWSGFSKLVADLAPRNAELLAKRDQLQAQIDAWHRAHPGAQLDAVAYRALLTDIGYLVPEGPAFAVDTANVDPEIARTAGPQLVVPVNNARYALNAANARWGSLYDALYGTDALPDADGAGRTADYNPVRGKQVIDFGRQFLDNSFPLTEGSHHEATLYRIVAGQLKVQLGAGREAELKAGTAFAGYMGSASAPALILLEHHGLHVELHIDRGHRIGSADAAGVSDIVLESAITTIQDCEDSVAATSTQDKILVYRNWLGLMKGTLEAALSGPRGTVMRRLNADRRYLSASGEDLTLPGRSLMLVRNVGQHMYSDAVTLDGKPIPETFIDAAITVLAALHDLRGAGLYRNSRAGSIYIVKPKMHGPAEVALANQLFGEVEDLLELPRNTLKIGIMDEERRTTVNLKECIRAVSSRVAFINTGFLDRTGDEIHTSMEAAAVPRKSELKKAGWLDAYERNNVDVGLACGLPGHAQIGKGMWAMPDLMADMLKAKIAHPRAGANTAWVPSPTAATLHALHYHEVDVQAVQRELKSRKPAALADILTPALVSKPAWTHDEIEEELNNNAQSILGYVVRWIDFGVGCSKVPDYFNVALMEDRATLRISSQHMANWLRHKVCTREQVLAALERMARVVDDQNAGDNAYHAMSKDLKNNIAYQSACELIFEGAQQPNGYTEGILTRRRLEKVSAH
jgi:malate synthase